MKSSTIRIWAWVHKWSSIVCTLFMLLLCLTGLPLVFNHELSHWLGSTLEAPALANPPPLANIDRLVDSAHQTRPQDAIQYLIWDDDPNVVQVIMAERPDSHPDTSHTLFIDARTADMLGQPGLNSFIFWMLKLHTDLFLGLPGKLFMGFMGLLFAVAVVSGVVLYHPFMRKLDFGSVRRQSLARTRWLDLHNLLGIATLVWALVVGVTGVVNTLADVAVQAWRADAVAAMVARYANYANKPAAAHGAEATLASTQHVTQTARAAEPGMTPYFIAWPGTVFSTPHHYAVYMRGNSPLTARLWKPLLIDAHSGELTDRRDPPWYLTGLLLTQPLHFGDYGGMPMKILWAVLDVITIIVLGSGLFLWLGPRRASKKPETEKASV